MFFDYHDLVYLLKNECAVKNISEWDDLFDFLENITSWAYLFRSVLNEIFHLYVHSDIFFLWLFISFAEMLL